MEFFGKNPSKYRRYSISSCLKNCVKSLRQQLTDENGSDQTLLMQSKNLNSGQGVSKGQLALFAQRSSKAGLSSQNGREKWDNLRQRLTQQLVTGKAECMVRSKLYSCINLFCQTIPSFCFQICLDKIKPVNATWDCQNCYQVFHIHCIKKWVKSQRSEADSTGDSWRCPGCQHLTNTIPKGNKGSLLIP